MSKLEEKHDFYCSTLLRLMEVIQRACINAKFSPRDEQKILKYN